MQRTTDGMHMGRITDWLLGPVPAPLEMREDAPGEADPSTAVTAPARRPSGKRVNSGEAFGLSMVYRAIEIHSTAAKQLSIHASRAGTAMPTPLLLQQPDVLLSRSAWIEEVVVSLQSNGNAYLHIQRDPITHKVLNLPVLNPLDIRIEHTALGTVTGYTYPGRDKPFLPHEIKHLKKLRVPGSVYGLGPIQAAQVELRGAIDTNNYSGNWFQDSPEPTGVLKSDSILSPDQAKQAKENWANSQGGKRGVAVMGQGLSYQSVYLSPADALWIEARQFDVTTIARLFGVPSSLMLANIQGNSQSYSNVEQDWLAYVRFGLMGTLVEIEEALTSLLPGSVEAKFNIEALLRADTTTRYAAYGVALSNRIQTVNEIRAIEGLPPVAWGDEPNTPTAPAAPTKKETTDGA